MRKAVTHAVTAVAALAGIDRAAAAAPVAEPQFVPISEIVAPILGRSRVEGTLTVSLVMQAADAEAAVALRARMPELRSASLLATLEFARIYASGFTPVDAGRLSADLNAALKKRYPGIARVLIVQLGAISS